MAHRIFGCWFFKVSCVRGVSAEISGQGCFFAFIGHWLTVAAAQHRNLDFNLYVYLKFMFSARAFSKICLDFNLYVHLNFMFSARAFSKICWIWPDPNLARPSSCSIDGKGSLIEFVVASNKFWFLFE